MEYLGFRRKLMVVSRKLREFTNEQPILHREYQRIKDHLLKRTPGNPALFGYKVYSQFDEDGIIAHIFSKIGVEDRVFIEIGCSDGLENNTHALLLQGWRGAWVDADGGKIRFITKHLPSSRRLVIKQAFVSAQNAVEIISGALAALHAEVPDFLSIDIDGDDLNVLMALLGRLKPRVICAEYNAKYPPPMQVAIRSRPRQTWSGDDYQGASLSGFSEALRPMGYRLIACGASGVNAFFVRNIDAVNFPEFTVEQLYQPARFDLRRIASGHPPSLKYLADALSDQS